MTAETRANPETLAALERPGKIVFSDGFESPDSFKKYFEIRGLQEGRAKLVTDAKLAHSGHGAIQFTAVARAGGAPASLRADSIPAAKGDRRAAWTAA